MSHRPTIARLGTLALTALTIAAPALASDDDLVKPRGWDPKQWVGFSVYAVLLLGLIVLAWRLARPDPDDGPTNPPTG